MSATGSADLWMVDWSEEERPRTELAASLVERCLRLAQRAQANSSQTQPLPSGDSHQVQRQLAIGRVPPLYRAGLRWDVCPVSRELRQWCDQLREHLAEGRGLILAGPIGTGKSSAAGLVCRAAARRGYTVRWATMSDLLTILRDKSNPLRAAEERRAQVEADLVVWDDFGAATLSEWEVNLCDEIVEMRYSRRRSMIVTTNLTTRALVEEVALARLVSRWRERNRAVWFTGPSLRRSAPSDGQQALALGT